MINCTADRALTSSGVYFSFFRIARLLDIVHEKSKLFLVFEYLNLDLKKYIETNPTTNNSGLPPDQVQVHYSYCSGDSTGLVWLSVSDQHHSIRNFNQLLHDFDLSLISAGIPLSITPRGRVLSLKANSSPRSEATKLAHWWKQESQAGRLWIGASVWYTHENVYARGHYALVSCTRDLDGITTLLDCSGYVERWMYLLRNAHQEATLSRWEQDPRMWSQ